MTGNGWAFPIDRAEVRIRLPRPVRFGERDVYTGPQGRPRATRWWSRERPGEIVLRTDPPARSP